MRTTQGGSTPVMLLYSIGLALALVLSAPVWGWRMVRQGRYREGLRQRLGDVPQSVRHFVQDRPVVWVHAVSVGETVTAERLIRALEEALPDHRIVLSTTTPTGQQVARERFGPDRVFYYPLDFAFAVRACLRAVRPRLLILMESELWPRMLAECRREGVPVAVVNARVSDRSLPRYLALRFLWRPLLANVSLLLAQSEQDAQRWELIGAAAGTVRKTGNLKYDVAVQADSPLAQLVRRHLPYAARVIVAGSTHPLEEVLLLKAFTEALPEAKGPAVLVLAPRHPARSEEVLQLIVELGLQPVPLSRWRMLPNAVPSGSVLLVDTVGELAPLYSLATCAFIGGSLIARGGHNPLEPAQFGVPVAIGPHYENFRAMVDAMQQAGAITVLQCEDLGGWFDQALTANGEDAVLGDAGQRALAFSQSQRGATERTVAALLPLLEDGRQP